MRRDELEHVIRAAASVLGDDGVIIVGSQVAHAALTAELPDVVARSIEADVLPLDDQTGDKAYLVNGTIGEESPFHETFGIYAEGVHEENLVLPSRWRDRLVALRSEGTRWLTGWCLDPHDAAAAKLLAGRPHDRDWCAALLRLGVLDPDEIQRRVRELPVEERSRRAVEERLAAVRRT